MQTSIIATACLSGSLSDNLRSAAEEGADDVDLRENDRLSFGGEPKDLEALATGTTPDLRVGSADPACCARTISSGRHALKGGGFSFRYPNEALQGR